MAIRPLDFVIKAIDQAKPTIAAIAAELRSLQQQSGKTSKTLEGLSGTLSLSKAVESISHLGAAYFGVQQAIGVAQAAGGKFYDLLIGQNERLNQEILQSAATIASTSRIFQNGIQLPDSGAAIAALQEPLQASIKQVEEATLNLVGVTSEQTSQVFNVILSNAGQLANQSKEFKDSIGAATALAPSLVATLGALKLPLFQANQEIRSILTGTIDQNSAIAKALNLNNQQVNQYKSQGILVDELIKKFQPFIEANKLAARSVSGLTSNIQDIVQLTARAAGKPLEGVLVDTLASIYDQLTKARPQIEAAAIGIFGGIAKVASAALAGAGDIFNALQPSLVAIGQALGEVFNAGVQNGVTFVEGLTAAIVGLIKVATPAVQLASSLAIAIAQFTETPIGGFITQAALGLATIDAVLPAIAGGFTALSAGVVTTSSAIGGFIAALSATNIGQALFTANQAAQAIVTGTTTAAIEAQALAMAQLTIGDGAAAAASLEVAAAEQAKAVAFQQSAITLAENAARLGLFAAAAASIAAVVQSFQELTKYSADAGTAIEDITKSLNDAAIASGKVSGNAAEQFNAIGDAATQNTKSIRDNLGGVQGFIQTLEESIPAFFASIAKAIFPNFAPQIDAALQQLDRFRIGLGFSTPLEAAKRGASAAFGEIANQATDTAQKIKDSLSKTLNSQTETALNDQVVDASKKLNEISSAIEDAKGKGDNDRVAQLGIEKSKIEETIAAINDKRQSYNKEREDSLKAIEANIAAVKNSKPLNPIDAQRQQDNIALLEGLKAKIEAINKLEIKPQLAPDRGNVFKQLQEEVDNATRSLATASTTPEVDAAAKRVTDAVAQQVKLGVITAEAGAKQLALIQKDGRASFTTQLAAQKGITDIYQGESDRRVEALKTEQTRIQSLVEAGSISAAEGAKKAAANQLQQLQEQLATTQAAIERNKASGQGDSQDTQKLVDREKDLQAQIGVTRAKERDRINQQELKDFDEQQQVLEGKKAEGLVSEQLFAQQSLQISLARADRELAQIKQQRSRLNKADTEGLEEVAAKEAAVYQKRQQALSAFEQAQLALVQAKQKEAQDTIALSSTQRETDLQALINSGVIRQSEAESKKVAIQRKGLQQQLAASKENADAIAALPAFSDPALERDRQSQIRAARLETANITKQLAENEYAAQQAAFNQYKEALDRQVQAARNNATEQTQPLESQLQLNEAINKSLEARSSLLEAQKGLAEAIAGLTRPTSRS